VKIPPVKKNYRRCTIILVDDRVGSKEIFPFINSPKALCHLEYADFAFSGCGPRGQIDVGVERKGIRDLIQSMTSGRLVGHQLIGLKEEYGFVYLLVEGIWRPDRRSGVLMKPRGNGWTPIAQGSRRFMARDVWAFLQSVSILCGVQVVATSNQWETGRWLDTVYGWWSRPWAKHKSHLQWQKPQEYASLRKPNLVTRLAAQLDGIGWDKARKMGEAFVDPLDFVTATEDELLGIDGIGPKLAKNVIKQLNPGGE
jgi:ERCC4-type nuclease